MSLTILRCYVIFALIFSSTLTNAHDISDPGFISGTFDKTYRLEQLPKNVRNSLEDLFQGRCPGIAEIGDQRFNSLDVLFPGIPCKRLIVAGNIGEIFILLYEAGGRGHHRSLLVMSVHDEKVEKVWSFMKVHSKRKLVVDDILDAIKNSDSCLVSPPREYLKGDESRTCD